MAADTTSFRKRTRSSTSSDERGIVVSCFDLTGIFVRPWAEAGYECHLVDVQHPASNDTIENVTKWGMDVNDWEKMFFRDHAEKVSRIEFVAFFPPCTDLAVSGARWFEQKEKKSPGTRKRAMDLIYWSHRMGEKLGCPFFIENPVSVISSEWRSPDFMFNPYQFGGYLGGEEDGYTKRTCLWVGGGFQLPPEKSIKLDPKTSDRIWRMAPSPERQNLRSQTPAGFSRAVFEFYNSKPAPLKR